MKSSRSGFATLIIALGLALAACSSEGDVPVAADGVVRAVDRQNAQITIKHGDIPGLMKAMTMGFGVSDPAVLEGVEAGDQIRFHVRYADGNYTVTAIEPR